MSDDLTELTACLDTPVPGLFLLRYRSALVLDALVARLRPQLGNERPRAAQAAREAPRRPTPTNA